jgi:hypothetical protein
MTVLEDEEVLVRARRIFSSLREKAPPIAIREVLEAVIGLKCSRLNVWQSGLEYLQALAREFNFGLAVSEWKIVPTLDAGKGDWSDGVLEYVPLEDSRGLFSAYLGSTVEEAIIALKAETSLGDDAFGKLLGIPSCCRRSYMERCARASSTGNDFLWETIGAEPRRQAEPAGANVVAQYFGRCLLSYFPCTLQCRASRIVSATRRDTLSLVAPELVAYLAEGHYWSTLVLRGRGMIAYPYAAVCEVGVHPQRNASSQVIGNVPDEFTCADRIFIDAEGYVVVKHNDRIISRVPGSQARLIAVANIW